MEPALEEKFFTGPDRTQFSYVDIGQGSPIVLLHGWSSSLRWFQRNLPELAKNHRVLALDFRGHGSSDKTASGHTMEQYARDVHDFIDGAGVRNPVLVGWSMGSIVLWNYVMQFGSGQASGMVFVGQSASDLITPEYEHGIFPEQEVRRYMYELQMDRAQLVANNFVLMLKHRPSDEELKWMTEDYLRCPAHIATVAFYHQTMADSMPAFPKIDFPSQVYFGVDPKMYKLVHGEYLASIIPGCELVVFEESGHVPMWEEPERFNHELHAFAERVAGRYESGDEVADTQSPPPGRER
jgi:non-heme chloroperoxidase